MDNMITVLVIEPSENPKVVEIKNELKAYQKTVGGWIEMVHLNDNTALICDEEGKIKGLETNRYFHLPFFKDEVVGTIIIVGLDNESGDFCSLNANQIKHFTDVFEDRLHITEI